MKVNYGGEWEGERDYGIVDKILFEDVQMSEVLKLELYSNPMGRKKEAGN